ncbi:hypothetical protein MTP03_18760 [Tsukamurella sp. PLM1]|nr:hypothetical protein MTP03_18760 [Tsukamurella sp. PLM1]
MQTMPTGTLIQNTKRQSHVASRPPATRPATEPSPAIAPKMANAWLRALPGANVVAISASAVGQATAANRP